MFAVKHITQARSGLLKLGTDFVLKSPQGAVYHQHWYLELHQPRLVCTWW